MVLLRPYQSDLVAAARSELANHKSVLIQACTGAGKTALASYMVHGAQGKNKRVFFTVHRKDLLKQTAVAFDDFNIPFSYIAAEKEYNPYSMTHICSIDTLKNRLGKTPEPHMLIVDECHMACSEGWSKVINYYAQKGAYIIGLSATPWRLDGSGLGRHFSSMVCGPSMRWLIDNKYLSDFRYFAPSHVDLTGIRITAGDYNKGDLSERMEGESVVVGDAIRHYKKHAQGKRAIVYCVSRKHSERVAQDFIAAGIQAKHIDGETPMDERRRIITDYADGRISVLCNVDLMTTGFDLAAQIGRDATVECIVLMRPTRSLSLFLQMVGRGLRPKPEPCIILDHANCQEMHMLPDTERTWTLDDRDRRRGGGERTIPVRSCPQCFFCFKPAPICPNCKYTFPIEYRTIKEVAGELSEIKEHNAEQAAKRARDKRFYSLKAVAKKRGLPMSWVISKMEKG